MGKTSNHRNETMNIDQQLEQLARLQYPKKVDVVDRVMEQVERQPYLMPAPQRHNARRLWLPVSAVAAAAAVLLAINVVSLYTHSYDEAGMGRTIAQLNDYNAWSTIEEGAVNPIEYLYDE